MGRLSVKHLLGIVGLYFGAFMLFCTFIKEKLGAKFLPSAIGVAGGYALLCILVMYVMYRGAVRRRLHEGAVTFRRDAPFQRYGEGVANFQYVFHHGEHIIPGLLESISGTLAERLGLPKLKPLEFTDRDKWISTPDTRNFHICSGAPGRRESKISFIAHGENSGTMQSIRWWIFLSGFIDRNRLLSMLAFAPLTALFRVIPYLKCDYDPLNSLISSHPGFYNRHDILTKVSYIQDAAFNALVDYLDRHDIDTSDLRIQRATVMNISVSGGHAQFGSVIQGAMNKVRAVRQGG